LGGYPQPLGPVPAGSVQNHQDEFIGMALGDLSEKHSQRFGVHRRQYERVQHSILRTDRCLRLLVLAHDLDGNRGSHARRCPAPVWLTDAAKARFLLKHQPHRATFESLLFYFLLDQRRELFLNSSWVAASAFGCWGRGWILRQPCRCRARYTTE
jgi:hypothetical protein